MREVIDPWMNLCDGTSDEDDELDDGEASEWSEKGGVKGREGDPQMSLACVAVGVGGGTSRRLV